MQNNVQFDHSQNKSKIKKLLNKRRLRNSTVTTSSKNLKQKRDVRFVFLVKLYIFQSKDYKLELSNNRLKSLRLYNRNHQASIQHSTPMSSKNIFEKNSNMSQSKSHINKFCRTSVQTRSQYARNQGKTFSYCN